MWPSLGVYDNTDQLERLMIRIISGLEMEMIPNSGATLLVRLVRYPSLTLQKRVKAKHCL